MAAELLLAEERDFRGPACTEACRTVRAIVPGRFGRSDLLLHDPATHEEYGRLTAGPLAVQVVVCTGPLVIDRWRREVLLSGERVELSNREWAILDHLAGQPGRTCLHAEILAAVWGPAYVEDTHLLRVNVARLRGKLRPWGSLLRSVFGVGLCLESRPAMLDPRDACPVTSPPRWSSRFAQCVCCGSDRRPHYSHGRCSRCQVRAVDYRRPHYGPCGAPPASEGL